MIDVKLRPFAGNLLLMALGAMKHTAVVKANQTKSLEKALSNIASISKEVEHFESLSFDVTASLIDKRFTSSKQFLSGGERPKQFNFKKSADINLQRVIEKNALRSRVKLNSAVTKHNKRLEDLKIRATFKLIDLKTIL